MAEMTEKMEKQLRHYNVLKTVAVVVIVSMVTAALTVWAIGAYVFPKEFKPVHLSQKEQHVLDTKLERINIITKSKPEKKQGAKETLKPERYSEEGATREVSFSEREVNALIANNTDLASKLAIDLDKDLASARLLLPLDPDLPIAGGKTLKAAAGLELRYADGKPVVVLKGVSLWGVPVPNAWLGNLKNIDLVKEFGQDEGFWRAFSEGIDHISIENDKVTVKFKE